MSAGKGDKRRPSQVSEQELEHKWQRTFGRSAAGSADAQPSRGCDTVGLSGA